MPVLYARFFLARKQELKRDILGTEISQEAHHVSLLTVFGSPVMTQDTHPLTAPCGPSYLSRIRNLLTRSADSFPTLEGKSIMNCRQFSLAKKLFTTYMYAYWY